MGRLSFTGLRALQPARDLQKALQILPDLPPPRASNWVGATGGAFKPTSSSVRPFDPRSTRRGRSPNRVPALWLPLLLSARSFSFERSRVDAGATRSRQSTSFPTGTWSRRSTILPIFRLCAHPRRLGAAGWASQPTLSLARPFDPRPTTGGGVPTGLRRTTTSIAIPTWGFVMEVLHARDEARLTPRW
jgi:hypothetical protein